MDNSGKNILITGGARGLGRSYANRFAKKGANVAAADINLESHKEYAGEKVEYNSIREEIEAHGVEGLEIEVDITNPDSVRKMVKKTVDQLGSIDVLVANAGGGDGPIENTLASELSYDYLHSTVERNLYGTVYSCIEAAQYMKEQGEGSIITVASRAGREARENGSYAHYGAAKAGIIMYTKYLAQDIGKHGVRANCIAPGPIATGRIKEKLYDDDEATKAVEESIPLGRFGDTEDCADTVEFLASDMSDFINGAVIPVDGGVVRGW